MQIPGDEFVYNSKKDRANIHLGIVKKKMIIWLLLSLGGKRGVNFLPLCKNGRPENDKKTEEAATYTKAKKFPQALF